MSYFYEWSEYHLVLSSFLKNFSDPIVLKKKNDEEKKRW